MNIPWFAQGSSPFANHFFNHSPRRNPHTGPANFVTAVHKPGDALPWGDIRADLRYA